MPSNYEQITYDNIRRRGEEFDDIGQLISEQLYSDRSHFVYELLQNAEDALERRFRENPNENLPCSVKFVLFEDKLEFRHFGQLFNEADVRGVCDVLKGTKNKDITQIGKFGIGFKSVYAFTTTPEIYSGDEHFVIERYIRPKVKEPSPSLVEGETLFIFPFNHKVLSRKDAFDLILNKMKTLGPRVLLFLNRINEIEWSVEYTGEGGQYLKEPKRRGVAKQVTVLGQKNCQDEEEHWLIFERPVPVPNGGDQVHVEAGFRLEINSKDQIERITRVKDAPLVVYFPTEKETRLGFLIQGPYKTTPARDNIPHTDGWNKKLVQETAYLIVDALMQLKDLSLLHVSLLEALPIRPEDFPEDGMFFPIFKAVREAFKTKELLPADDGSFVSAQRAKLARGADLRKLLDHEQLRSLFQSKDIIKWLTGSITQDRTPELRTYLLNELDIEEIIPDSFARKITQSFLSKQPDEWLLEFYRYLSGQEALWRSPRWSSEGGLLRSKPIIRLQDDNHVIPFRADGITPNAFLPPPEDTDFPVVKRSIAIDERARDFLKRLGLSEPDVFDDIVERVLPKYLRAGVYLISENEHAADIQKILRALASDSEAGKKKVINKAKETPFLRAVNRDGETAFIKPGDIYLQTDELRTYFNKSQGIWFLVEMKGEPQWLALGVSRKPRFVKMKIDLPWDEKRRLMHNQGHTRDIDTTDYDLDGLDDFLLRFPVDKQHFKRYSLIFWNFLLQHLKETTNYSFYEGEYRWFYYQERLVLFEPTWKKRLRNHKWLPKKGNDIAYKPEEISLNELPDQFERNEKLADRIEMKKDIVAKLAEEAGINRETIELARELERNPDILKSVKEQIQKKTEFPTQKVADPDRRKIKVLDDLQGSEEKQYEPRTRSVRVSEATQYVRTWLQNQYKNEDGQIVCQMCEKEMPFKKLDGEYYFEAVEAFTKDIFSREHEAQFLALCPLCAAMYKELVKKDETARADLRTALLSADSLKVPLRLGDKETTIRFVETHFHDIKTILEETKQDDGEPKEGGTGEKG